MTLKGDLAQVEHGMTEEEVVRVLGGPGEVSEEPELSPEEAAEEMARSGSEAPHDRAYRITWEDHEKRVSIGFDHSRRMWSKRIEWKKPSKFTIIIEDITRWLTRW
jgi:hypothetical protein